MSTIAIPKTMQAVRLSSYGGPEVLELADVPGPRRPRPAASWSGSARPRSTRARRTSATALLAEIYPMDFPFGEGSDLAGEVVADAEGFTAGEAVFGWSDERSAHAEYVSVPADAARAQARGPLVRTGRQPVRHRRHRPSRPSTRCALQPGETVVISAAAGGVGVLATQLAVRTGARVLALASPSNHDWLRDARRRAARLRRRPRVGSCRAPTRSSTSSAAATWRSRSTSSASPRSA